MSTENASQKLSISDYCHKCFELYSSLCDGLSIATTQQALDIGFDLNAARDFAQDARSRFKAWAVNIAALQGAHLQSSLDSRLKDATEIRQRILKILKALAQSLWDASMIINGSKINEKWEDGAISDSDEDNASNPGEATQTSDLEQQFIAIKTANSSLMKLSMVIRNSPARDDYLKAASRHPFDARYDIGHVKEKHGAAKRSSDWLLERLGKAITRRRQYLKYREEHHTKLSRDWEAATVEGMGAIVEMEAPLMSTAKATEDERPEKTIALTKLTKATTYVENKTMIERDGIDLDQGSFGSQTSYEPTVVGEAVHKLGVPPPPVMAFEDVPFEFGEPFQCPYCYMEQTVKNKTAWKKHVFRDLKPYVCTFKECHLKMFRSRNEWFAHEMQNHRREWVCMSCLETFTDNANFSEHLQSMHGNLVASSQLEALVLQCEEPVDKIPASACPLCDEWESNLLDPKQNSKRLFLNNGEVVEPCGTLVQFRRHLGRHMEQLALFALPMAEEDEMEDDSVEESSDDGDIPKDKDVALDPKDEEPPNEDSNADFLSDALKGPILRRVQFSVPQVDELIELLFDEFRSVYYPGEVVTVHLQNNESLIGTLTDATHFGSKVLPDGSVTAPFSRYFVNLGDRSEVIVDNDHIARTSSFTKKSLRVFVEKNASRDSWEGAPWVVKPEVASIYRIDTNIPPDLKVDAYHHRIVDVAVEEGPTEVRNALEKYPLLLAHPDYFRYLLQAISKSSYYNLYNHILYVVDISIVIENIHPRGKKEDFLDIVNALAIPAPEMLIFEHDGGIFTRRAFARFATIKGAEKAVSELDGFSYLDRTLRVKSLRMVVPNIDIVPLSAEQTTQSEENDYVDEEGETDEEGISTMKRIADMDLQATGLREMQLGLEVRSEDQKDVDSRSIFVGNLAHEALPGDIQGYFQTCGPVNRVTILLDKFTGRPNGHAYVEFAEPGLVAQALTMNESVFYGQKLEVVPKPAVLRETTTSEISPSKVAVGEIIDLEGFGGEIKTNEGWKTNLKELVDNSENGVIIFTYAKASGPEASTEACLFRDHYSLITGHGFSLYGLSNDVTMANTNFIKKHNLPYTLLCDLRSTLISAIGMQKFQFGTTPGVFIVDKSGKVLEAQPSPPTESLNIVKRVLGAVAETSTPAASARQATMNAVNMSLDEADGRLRDKRKITDPSMPSYTGSGSQERERGALVEEGTTPTTAAEPKVSLTDKDFDIMTSILNRISNYRNEDGQDISKVLERIVNKQVLPDYFDIIKEPVAISTLRQKIAKRQYANFKDFVRDFALIFHNAQVYNRPSSVVDVAAITLREVFKAELKKLVDDNTITSDDAELPDLSEAPEDQAFTPPGSDDEETDNLSHPRKYQSSAAAVGAAIGTGAPHHPENTSTRLAANEADVDEQIRKPGGLRTSVIHLLAVEELSEVELRRKLGMHEIYDASDLQLGLKQTLKEVALLRSHDPAENMARNRWQLKPDLYKELDVWSFTYRDAEERKRAIKNATNQYRQLGVGPEEPEWTRLLPEAERTPIKFLKKNEKAPARAQNLSFMEIQDDEIIALAAMYGKDFRQVPPTLDQGWKRFEIRIRSSHEETFTLRVTLPATYPLAEPELALHDYLSLGEDTRQKVRTMLDTQLELMRLNEDEQPMIMELVNACSDILEHAVQDEVVSKKPVDAVQEAQRVDMRPFVFRWEHPASEVFVTGTFDNWSKSEKLIQIGDVFEKEVALPITTEKIYYKFVVDGRWVTNDTAPQETDDYGIPKNVLTAEHIAAGAMNSSSIAKASLGEDSKDNGKSNTGDLGSSSERPTGRSQQDSETYSWEDMLSIDRAQPTVTTALNSIFYSVIVRGFPTSMLDFNLEEAMQSLSPDFIAAEVLRPKISEKLGLGSRSAIIRFQSHQGALDAKKYLDELQFEVNDSQMLVEVVHGWSTSKLAASVQLQQSIQRNNPGEPGEQSSPISTNPNTDRIEDANEEGDSLDDSGREIGAEEIRVRARQGAQAPQTTRQLGTEALAQDRAGYNDGNPSRSWTVSSVGNFDDDDLYGDPGGSKNSSHENRKHDTIELNQPLRRQLPIVEMDPFQSHIIPGKWDAYKTMLSYLKTMPQCIGITKTDNRRCGNPLSPDASREIRTLTTQMEGLSVFNKLYPILVDLAPLCLCKDHRIQAPEVLKSWVASFARASDDSSDAPTGVKPAQVPKVSITLKVLLPDNDFLDEQVIYLTSERPAFFVSQATNTITDSSQSSLEITWHTPDVSRDHAQITMNAEEKEIVFMNLEAPHGMSINGDNLPRRTAVFLGDGDILEFGSRRDWLIPLKVQINFDFFL